MNVVYDLDQFNSTAARTGIYNYSWRLISELAGNDAVVPYFFSTKALQGMEIADTIAPWVQAERVIEYTRLDEPKLFPWFEGDRRSFVQRISNRAWYEAMLGVERLVGRKRFQLHRPEGLDLFHFTRYQITRADIPIVATLHDMIYRIHPEYFTRQGVRLNRRIMNYYETHVRVFVAVSETTRDDAIRLTKIPADRIIVAPNAIDDGFFPEPDTDEAQDFRSGLGLDGNPYFACLSTLEIRKNHLGVIRAFDHFRRDPKFSDYRLLVIGGKGWKYNDVYAELEKLGLSDVVYHTGYLTQPLIRRLLSDAKGLVFPSFYEGFGLPPLEALACGCPVVASRLGALPEVLGDCAEYADAHDPVDIARAMAALIGDETSRKRMIDCGRARAADYSMARCARETLRAYQLALEG